MGSVNGASEVVRGSHVKNMFIELWVAGDGTDLSESTVTLQFAKMLDDEVAILSNALVLLPNDQQWRNRIFLYSKGNVQYKGNAGFVPFFRGWIKIPKSHQKMTQDSNLTLSIASSQNAVSFCGFATYKSYF